MPTAPGHAQHRRRHRAQGTHPPIEKLPTGVAGLDEITGGGIPRNRTTVIKGGPGSGKTVLALQVLASGAREFTESGVFVAFEERSANIVANAAGFGWDLPGLEKKGMLAFLDARITPDMVRAGDFDLTGLLVAVKAKADQIGARRVVFDAIDAMLALLEEPALERRELHRLQDWLDQHGLTAVVTSKSDAADPGSIQRDSFLQFMADAVIGLSHFTRERISLRSLRVMKYRGSSFAENEAPMVIGRAGIELTSISSSAKEFFAPTERISTGVGRLDTMLEGGYFRGASVLITGAPGTSKSTLSAAFAEAACRRGDRVLYVSFDESAAEIVRNSGSLSIDLAREVRRGRLRLVSTRADAMSADAQLLQLRTLIEEFQPQCLVIDPISALVKGGGEVAALSVTEQLLHVTKTRGITILCTSLLDGNEPNAEASSVQISTIADTWIHLAYAVRSGERNRALTIVKSRGTRHSNQVRELILSREGISLADVYSAGGEVLMGTMRWQKESDAHAEDERLTAEIERKRREIEHAKAEASARREALLREVEAKELELATLVQQEALRHARTAHNHQELLQKRGADRDSGEKHSPQSASPAHRHARKK